MAHLGCYASLKARNLREVRKFYPQAQIITGRTSTEERNRTFSDFKRGKIRLIVTTTVLDEGIDAPDSDVANRQDR